MPPGDALRNREVRFRSCASTKKDMPCFISFKSWCYDALKWQKCLAESQLLNLPVLASFSDFLSSSFSPHAPMIWESQAHGHLKKIFLRVGLLLQAFKYLQNSGLLAP